MPDHNPDAGSPQPATDTDRPPAPHRREWLNPAVGGIGGASLLADAGHEVPTALLPSLLTATLGAPAAALGLIEGIADALAGASRLAGGALADDPHRRRTIAVGGYTVTAIASAAIGLARNVWQVGILRAGAWSARGLRVPARNALLADAVPTHVYGRAYGFERAMDNLGAIAGPLLALALITTIGIRGAILASIVPGLAATVAIIYAIRHTPTAAVQQRQPIRLHIRPLLHGDLGRLLAGVGAFEVGNVAATLLILRATQLLTPNHGVQAATQLALLLYAAYNLAATLVSFPAGQLTDRLGNRQVLRAGIALFALAYLGFAITGANLATLSLLFATAGIAIGLVETAEHAAIATHAPGHLRGSAFGLLAGIQSLGNLAASGIAGLLWTLLSPAIAFVYLVGWMTIAVFVLRRPATHPIAGTHTDRPR